TNYKHQVIVFDIEEDKLENLHSVEIPVSVPLKRIPKTHSVIEKVLSELQHLEIYEGDQQKSPYLQVRVLLQGPEPGLRHKVETALTGKNYRLAKIDVRYELSAHRPKENHPTTSEQLNELQPKGV